MVNSSIFLVLVPDLGRASVSWILPRPARRVIQLQTNQGSISVNQKYLFIYLILPSLPFSQVEISSVLFNTTRLLFQSSRISFDLLILALFGLEGGSESARADFIFQELPWYLSNSYKMWPILLKFIGKQDSGKILRKGMTCCHGNPVFDAMFTQTLTF